MHGGHSEWNSVPTFVGMELVYYPRPPEGQFGNILARNILGAGINE